MINNDSNINTNTQEQIAVLSFYSFVKINEPEVTLQKILLVGKKKRVKGTILIAKEGFNGSISGSREIVEFVLQEIVKITNALDVNSKVNYCQVHPFSKFKVKLKKEIIALNVGELDVAALKGEYIEPKDWDNFISQKDVILIDTRNDYEIEVGTFKGSINPHTDTFKQFPAWAHEHKEELVGKKIAMVCTGGIRCEKSTAFMKQLGFNEVYHLKGGILQYLEDTKNAHDLWEGECFVFDDRRAVDEDLSPSKQGGVASSE